MRKILWGMVLSMCFEAAALAASTTVVISEFRTRGAFGADDEFVELFNLSNHDIDISGYKLNASSSAGNIFNRATVPPGTIMRPKTYYLFTDTFGTGYHGSADGDATYSTSINDGGGIALLNTSNQIVDAVGMSSGSAYKEGTVLTPMSVNKDQSYIRLSTTCGPDTDTDNNAADFEFRPTYSYPENSTACRLGCAGDPCFLPSDKCEIDGTLTKYSNPYCDAMNDICEYDEDMVICDLPPNADCYDPDGTCINAACEYVLNEGDPCDNPDSCTVDSACDAAGDCVGTPMVCIKPPTCEVGNTLSRKYTNGACSVIDGECDYVETDADCGVAGCNPATGLCNGADPCQGITCNTPPNAQCYNSPGQCTAGVCDYTKKNAGTDCNDSNTCTDTDKCDAAGTCAGTAKVCTPPNPTCENNNTVSRTYSNGICQAGACVFQQTDVSCGSGCNPVTGVCSGDPCQGITCNNPPDLCHVSPGVCSQGNCAYGEKACEDPPADDCVDDDTLKKYNPEGTCTVATGACAYTSQNVVCEQGCDQLTNKCKTNLCQGVVCNGADLSGAKCGDQACYKCMDQKKSIEYSKPGTCGQADGKCTYQQQQTTCANSCDPNTGKCTIESCTGGCTKPPTTCFEENGTCTNGVCTYKPKAKDTTCDDGDRCTVGERCNGVGDCASTPDQYICTAPDSGCGCGTGAGSPLSFALLLLGIGCIEFLRRRPF
jgi:MYXO-CTERM domain-containing protein